MLPLYLPYINVARSLGISLKEISPTRGALKHSQKRFKASNLVTSDSYFKLVYHRKFTYDSFFPTPEPKERKKYKEIYYKNAESNRDYIKKNYKIFSHNKVIIFDQPKNQCKRVISMVHFCNFSDMKTQDLDDYNFLTQYLVQHQKFVGVQKQGGKIISGKMWGMGWRVSYTAGEVVGRYLAIGPIQKNPEAYEKLSQQGQKVAEILGKLFKSFADKAFQKNQEIMKENSALNFDNLNFSFPESVLLNFANHITYTSHGFANFPHIDSTDASDYALYLSFTIDKITGKIITENYNVTEEYFVFPDHAFAFNFSITPGIVVMLWRPRDVCHFTMLPVGDGNHTRLALSIQLSQETLNIFKGLADGAFNDKKNILDHQAILNYSKQPKKTRSCK